MTESRVRVARTLKPAPLRRCRCPEELALRANRLELTSGGAVPLFTELPRAEINSNRTSSKETSLRTQNKPKSLLTTYSHPLSLL